MCSIQCQRSNTLGMLCTLISAPRRPSRTVSVFPAAIIASFDSSLKGLNARCCWRSLWSAFSLRVILDLLNQVVNVNAVWSFHHRIWHAWDVEVDVFVINRKVELVRVWRCNITMFEENQLLALCASLLPQVSPFDRDHSWRDGLHISQVSRTKFSLQPFTNNLSWTGRVFLLHKFHRSINNWIGFGLG